jgi:hypothetical protein
MNTKKKIVVSYENLDSGVKMAILKKYPNGYTNHVFKVTLPNNNFFHAVTVDTEDASYLVKVKVKLDKAEKLEEDLFNNELDKVPDDAETDNDADTVSDADESGKAE